MRSPARAWHTATFLVCSTALVLQFVTAPPRHIGAATRLGQLLEYFTVDGLVLMCVSAGLLVGGVWADRAAVRVLRFVAVTSMCVMTVVYATLINSGPAGQDTSAFGVHALPHYVVPVMAVVGWVAFGPRGWVDGRAVYAAVVWPIAWFCVVFVRGESTDYYPYRFMNPETIGYPRVAVNVALVLLTVAAVALLGVVLDRRPVSARVRRAPHLRSDRPRVRSRLARRSNRGRAQDAA